MNNPPSPYARVKFFAKSKKLKDTAKELATRYESEVAVVTRYMEHTTKYASPNLGSVLNRHGYVHTNDAQPVTMVENASANLNVREATDAQLVHLEELTRQILSNIREEEERQGNN